MRYIAGLLLGACGLICGAACNSTSPSAALTGSVTDPAGDAVTADVVSVTIDVSGGQLTVTLSFVPGTLSKPDIFASILLDTDENPATGYAGVTGGHDDAALIGFDYEIDVVSPRGSSTADIVEDVNFTTVGTAAVTFPSADQAKVTVPLSKLGNDDGRLKFKVMTSHYITNASRTGWYDAVPDLGVAPGIVK